MMDSKLDLFETIRSLLEEGSDRGELEAEIRKKYEQRCAMLVLDSTGFTKSTQDSGIISYLECIVRLRDLICRTIVIVIAGRTFVLT